MSQQQMFDEERSGYQAGYTPSASYDERPDYQPPIGEQPDLKLGQTQFTPSASKATATDPYRITAGMRLGLAIVSVGILLPILGVLLSDNSANYILLIVRLIALAVVSFVIVLINFIFNHGH